MTDKLDIARNIKELRKEKNMTQTEFAVLIGKSQSTVYGYESGQILPTFETLCRMSEVLSVEVERLLGLSGKLSGIEELRAFYLEHIINNQE